MGLLSQRKEQSNGDEKTNIEFTEILKRQLNPIQTSNIGKDQLNPKKDKSTKDE